MDRDFIFELFSEFGPVTLRRMFSGYGVTAEGVNFAVALRGGLIFRVDEQSVAKYSAEGSKPFQYDTKSKTVVVSRIGRCRSGFTTIPTNLRSGHGRPSARLNVQRPRNRKRENRRRLS